MTKTSDSLSILQMTDLHIMEQPGQRLQGVDTAYYFQAVLRQAFAESNSVDQLLLTGDLTQNGRIEAYQLILELMQAYPVPTICLPGNHDDFALMQRVLVTDTMTCQKQKVFAQWQIIALNSQIYGEDGGALDSQELFFLETCLKAYPAHYALIAIHHPCYPIQSAWLDTMAIKNSAEFKTLLIDYPQVKAVICGHIHQEFDMEISGIRLFGTPSTCFQFKPESKTFALDNTMPGYRRLNLFSDGRLETSVSRLPGKLMGLSSEFYDH